MMKTYKSLSQYKQLIYGIKGISASPPPPLYSCTYVRDSTRLIDYIEHCKATAELSRFSLIALFCLPLRVNWNLSNQANPLECNSLLGLFSPNPKLRTSSENT